MNRHDFCYCCTELNKLVNIYTLQYIFVGKKVLGIFLFTLRIAGKITKITKARTCENEQIQNNSSLAV